ncbi:MAG TPA: hypothetical protein PK002_03520 [Cellvibrio sp.]|nr:hypothetical protein [Cellvibrio sp.]
MYIWNVNALIEELKEGKLSQKEQFKYAIAYSVLMLLASDPLLHAGQEYSYIDSIQSLLLLVVSVLGMYFCYCANKKADDKDFLLRFFTIGLPITVRCIAIIFPLALVVGAVDGFTSSEASLESGSTTTSIYQVIITGILVSAFYVYYQSKFHLFGISKTF